MTPHRSAAGFTLIDALIAIVVLVTGILALTLLQTTMLRATAEARDRSEAASVAQNLIEGIRAQATETQAGYQALDVAGTFDSGECDFDATTLTVENYTGSSGGTDVDDVDYRYCVNVRRFLDTAGDFNQVAISGGTEPAYGGTVSEFKHVEVQVGWRKPDGTWGRLTVGDAISGIPLANSRELENRPLGGTTLADAAVVQYPGNYLADEDNFIPIAVGSDGSGQQIAATNPSPEVIGAGVAETSFQIYTYLSQTNAIQVQRQIDTKVVSCSCTLEQASNEPTGFLDFSLRPSYWDGRRYTAPQLVENQQNYLRGVPAGGANESQYCDICCRDHHDPAGLDYNGEDDADPADDLPKVDPFTSHDHYADAQAPALVAAGDTYDEVCRLVRVDGIYRVTPDPSIEHFAYVPTDNGTRDRTTESIAPDYNRFVRDYIEERLLPIGNYDATDSMPETASPPVDVTALENTWGLNSQAGTPIVVSDQETSPVRYLQNRAVILDALEYSARKTIEAQIAANASCQSDPLPCVLAFVPFASINLTMLSEWSKAPNGVFTINPQDVVDPNDGSVDAYAGQVGLEASPTGTSQSASIINRLSRTVAALVDRFELFPTVDVAEQDTWRHEDTQPFQRTNASPTGASFRIVPTGLSYFDDNEFDSADAPDVRWVSGTSQGVCVFAQASKSYSCHVFDETLLADMSVRINNYHGNLEVNTKPNSSDGFVCAPPNNKKDFPSAKCAIFTSSLINVTPAPVSFALTPSPATSNPSDDQITIGLGAVISGASYTVDFDFVENRLPSGTCNTVTGVVTWEWATCRTD